MKPHMGDNKKRRSICMRTSKIKYISCKIKMLLIGITLGSWRYKMAKEALKMAIEAKLREINGW
jgi:hypothetical protein